MSTYTEWFRFSSEAAPDSQFHIIRFKGTEGLNQLFSFDIYLACTNASLNIDDMLSEKARLSILREDGGTADFVGRLESFMQEGQLNGWTYYRAKLRPCLWKLSQYLSSAVFVGQDLPALADELLKSGHGLVQYKNRLVETYPAPEFAMQYEESDYDYLRMRLNEKGAYYYFDAKTDDLVIADSPHSHNDPSMTLRYAPFTGLEGDMPRQVLSSFVLRQTSRPKTVVVRNYDWKDPSKMLVGKAEVPGRGEGVVYYGSANISSKEDADNLAKLQAESIACQSRVFHGKGSVAGLRPGVVFKLTHHYNRDFNRNYLVTEVTHEGSQETVLSLCLGITIPGGVQHLFYRSDFRCIEADTPWRPGIGTERKRIPGIIRAFVDGTGSGARAEMDEYGRYKLLFPFDIRTKGGGEGSAWVRQARPNVGADSGMSFPLLPGAEVMVSFTESSKPFLVIQYNVNSRHAINSNSPPPHHAPKTVHGVEPAWSTSDFCRYQVCI